MLDTILALLDQLADRPLCKRVPISLAELRAIHASVVSAYTVLLEHVPVFYIGKINIVDVESGLTVIALDSDSLLALPKQLEVHQGFSLLWVHPDQLVVLP